MMVLFYYTPLFCAIWQMNFVFTGVSCQTRTRRTVYIVSPGIMTFSTPAALNYIGPAIETGVQRLNDLNPQLTWRSVYLVNPSVMTCAALAEDVQDRLSRWYYTVRNASDITVIVTGGKYSDVKYIFKIYI